MKAQTSSIGHLIQSHLRRWKELTELSPQSTFCNCNLPLHPLFSSGDGVGAQIPKGPLAKGCKSRCGSVPTDQKRRCQIGHPAPDILTGAARRHPPGSIFRFAGWAPAGPGPARAVLGWPAGACWRPQQPKHGLHTPPELWNAFGACGGLLGAKCHSRLPTSSNSLFVFARGAAKDIKLVIGE